MDIKVGDWAVVRGYSGDLNPSVFRVAVVTDKLIKKIRWGNKYEQKSKTDVIAIFENESEAEDLIAKIGGIKGERDRRINAAHIAARDSLHKLLKRKSA